MCDRGHIFALIAACFCIGIDVLNLFVNNHITDTYDTVTQYCEEEYACDVNLGACNNDTKCYIREFENSAIIDDDDDDDENNYYCDYNNCKCCANKKLKTLKSLTDFFLLVLVLHLV